MSYLEIGGDDTFAGVAPVNPPSSLAPHAFNDGGFASYHKVNGYAVGMQIDGTVVAVPEPESYALFLAGLGLTDLIARRRKPGTNA